MEQQRVDIISDVMTLTTYRNSKNTIILTAELSGFFREDIFRAAVREASVKFPAMRSVLREVWSRGRYFFIREPGAVDEVPIFVNDLPTSGQSSFDTLMECLTPRLDRQWDLFREPPVEIHLFRGDSSRVLMTVLSHHSSSDAAMALMIVTEIFGQYERILTGKESQWLEMPYVLSTSKKRAADTMISWKQVASQLRRDWGYRKGPPVKPIGQVDPADLREWHTRETLSAEDTEQVLSGATARGFQVVDHLAACANVALEEWNSTRKAASDIITTVMTINMRRRFRGAGEQNYSSALFLRTAPEDRQNFPDLVRLLCTERGRQLRRHADLAARKALSLGSKLAFFPLGIRRRICHAFMMSQTYSLAVGFLGILWPEFESDRRIPLSRLRTIGDLKVVDAFGSGYKLAGNAYINLYAYVYGGRLNLVSAVPATILNKNECRDFLGLLVKHLKRVI